MLTEHRLDQHDELLRALGSAVGQVARIDAALDNVKETLTDERDARRKYFSETLDMFQEIRDDIQAHKRETAEQIAQLKTEVMQAVQAVDTKADKLDIDQRNGNRALIGTVATSVLALLGALAWAYAQLKGAVAR